MQDDVALFFPEDVHVSQLYFNFQWRSQCGRKEATGTPNVIL